MKKINILLLIILIGMALFAGVFLLGGTLSADAQVISADASDYPDAFASIQNLLAADAVPQVFAEEIPASADGCTLLDVTVTLTNRGLFDAEWADVRVSGGEGDVAVYSLTGEGTTIPAHGTGTINFKLITYGAASQHRTVTIQYYVYGMSRTAAFSL